MVASTTIQPQKALAGGNGTAVWCYRTRVCGPDPVASLLKGQGVLTDCRTQRILLHFPWKARAAQLPQLAPLCLNTPLGTHFFWGCGVNTRLRRNKSNDAKRRGHSKKGAHKGEKVKSRVAFQGTIDRRKKAFHPKTPATSKPQFQSPDFLSPEKSKAESRNAFFESSSPTNNGVLGIKKNNFKIAAVRKSIVNQHQRLRVGGKLLHTETSPRVGDHQILTNNMDTASSTCCDEPLGSPIRRMKRAMRYVDKNTCITQRVAIDVGTDTRIIIPCFEGITTVMDLVETVRQRFPEQNIVELQLFNKTLPVEGFVAELIDAEHVLTAISKSTVIDGIKPAGVAVGQMNNIDEIREESEDAKGNSRIISSDSQSNDSQRVLECSGVDEIRTIMISRLQKAKMRPLRWKIQAPWLQNWTCRRQHPLTEIIAAATLRTMSISLLPSVLRSKCLALSHLPQTENY